MNRSRHDDEQLPYYALANNESSRLVAPRSPHAPADLAITVGSTTYFANVIITPVDQRSSREKIPDRAIPTELRQGDQDRVRRQLGTMKHSETVDNMAGDMAKLSLRDDHTDIRAGYVSDVDTAAADVRKRPRLQSCGKRKRIIAAFDAQVTTDTPHPRKRAHFGWQHCTLKCMARNFKCQPCTEVAE